MKGYTKAFLLMMIIFIGITIFTFLIFTETTPKIFDDFLIEYIEKFNDGVVYC